MLMLFGTFLQECAQIFETLQADYSEEYKTMGLSDLAVAVVHPLLKEKLRSWDPLKVLLQFVHQHVIFFES